MAQRLLQNDRLDSLMLALHGRGQFNGSILVSVSGNEMVYEKAYAYKPDLEAATKRLYYRNASATLASALAKQFTSASGHNDAGGEEIIGF